MKSHIYIHNNIPMCHKQKLLKPLLLVTFNEKVQNKFCNKNIYFKGILSSTIESSSMISTLISLTVVLKESKLNFPI